MADKDKGERATAPAYLDKAAEPEEIARYQEILAREASSLVFAALAEAYRRRNMLDQAIAVCRKGLHHHPDFVSGRVALARAYVEKGETERAARELERVILSAPDNLVAQRLLLTIYEARGETESLEETLHRILSLDPHDDEARRAWERLQSRRGNKAGETETQGGSREIVTQTLAEIYAAQGYHEKAVEIYQKLSMREPANPVIHARIADLKQKAVHRVPRVKGRDEERGFSAD